MTTRTTPGDGYSGGGTSTYTYAGTDQTELISQTGLLDYTYGRTNAAGLPIIESYAKGGTTTSYTYDPQGTPLAVEGANSHYLALDGLGSPVALVNNSGGHTGTYTYDPYGQATATAVGGSGAIGIQIYGYAGGIDDPNSTLVHFGQRWYDPTTGRFTQQDALETLADPTRANRYEYAASNPINYVDPTGLANCELATAAGAVAGALVGIGVAGAIGNALTGGNPAGALYGAFEGGAVGAQAGGGLANNLCQGNGAGTTLGELGADLFT